MKLFPLFAPAIVFYVLMRVSNYFWVIEELIVTDSVEKRHGNWENVSTIISESSVGKKFTYWPIVINEWNQNGNLRTMKRVLDRLGYEMVDGMEEDWHLMWSIEYPYDRFPEKIANKTFSGHQRLNHFPGMNFLSNKKTLNTKIVNSYLLPAFRIPEDRQKFEKFTTINPKARFVVKHFGNRGVRIVSTDEIKSMNLDWTQFIQVFMEDPLLIDGRAFDIGVYVLITSLEPLTVYRFKSECLLRFCTEPYYPFNANNTRKYVVSDDKLHAWEMKSFESLIGQYSHLRIFENHLKSRDYNITELWKRIDDAIVLTILQTFKLMHREFEKECSVYKCTNENFFELLRFDFMIDKFADVHLMEVNMSPNLTPSLAKYERSAATYEQVVYNTLRVVGAEGFGVFKEDVNFSPMTSQHENLAVLIESCKSCRESCNSSAICELCINCMSPELTETLHKAHREHQRRGEFKRIFPTSDYIDDDELLQLMTRKTKTLLRWFDAKCDEDDEWC